jgi:hypothetical protein
VYTVGASTCVVKITLKNFGQSPSREASVICKVGTPNLENPSGEPFLYSHAKMVDFYEIPASGEDTVPTILKLSFAPTVCAEIVERSRACGQSS